MNILSHTRPKIQFFCSFLVAVMLGSLTLQAQTIPKNENHTDAQGRRQGTWTILYDKDWKVIQDTTQAQFYRIIRYQNDLPVGNVRDYYRSGQLQWEGHLLQDRPKELIDGKCVWYYENGKVERIGWFEEGTLVKKQEYLSNRAKQALKDLSVNGLKAIEEGKYELAGQMLKKAKLQEEILFGKENVNYAASCNNLALLYASQGKYSEAEPLYSEAKKIVAKVLGVHNLSYASCCNNLAALYDSQGKYTEAKPLYSEAKQILAKVLGTNHPTYAKSCDNLAGLYKEQGKYTEAEPLYLEAQQILARVLGTYHPSYATSCSNLAGFYLSQGKYAEAKPLYLEAKQIRTKVFGIHHPDYANSCDNLAGFYLSQAKYAEAKLLYLEAKRIRAKVFGVHHPDYASSCNNLAKLYKSQGKYAKAEPLYLEAQKLRVKSLGIHHPDYASSCNNLADLYMSQGKHAEAKRLYLEAKQIRAKVFGIHHPDYASSCNNLAVLYTSEGKYAEAEPLYMEAKQIIAKSLGVHHSTYATFCDNLAVLYASQGKYAEAKPLYLEAQQIRAKVFGTNHPSYATSCNNLADLYKIKGQYAKAESLCLEAKRIFIKLLGTDHPSYAISCISLLLVYKFQGKFGKEFTLWQQVFANLQTQFKQNLAYASEKNRQQYLQKNISHMFYSFHSFAQNYIDSLGIPQSKEVLTQWYNNQLLTKALLFQSTQKTKERIYSSGDTALIRQFEEFVARRGQRNKVLEWTIGQRKKAGVNLDSLNAQINTLEQALARKSVEFAAALEEYEWHSWQEVQQQLKPGEVAIEIIRYNRWDKRWTDTVHYAALIVTPNSPYPTPVFLKNGNELEGKAFQYYQRRNVVKKAHTDPHSYAHFWQPIQAQLQHLYPNAKRVFVSLDGVYHQINLETLWHPGQKKYLGELLDIRLVSSTKDLLNRGKSQPVARGKKVELFGFPTYASAKQATQKKKEIESFFDIPSSTTTKKLRDLHQGHITPLPGTKKEVEQIGQLLQQQGISHQVHLAHQASEDQVKALKNPRILHLATHGYFLQDDKLLKGYRRQGLQWHWGGTDIKQYVENPLLRCGLLWAGAEATIKNEKHPQGEPASRFIGENGLLTAQEALNLNLDSTQLVILSACETGKGKIQNGEGVYGLQRAFLSAGAKNVLMSLWKVDDTATQWFMQYFYESWAKDQRIRKAYHYAQRKLRVDYPSPYYWGAFVLVGR
ncbi:MAG TPA: hypothetical protein DCS93_03285 [Microscillaceae bacterium]|nr:hypothetical protein [Microscillaceae bacterium]